MILTVVVLGCTVTDDDFENVLTASTLVVTLFDLICLFFGINLIDNMDVSGKFFIFRTVNANFRLKGIVKGDKP